MATTTKTTKKSAEKKPVEKKTTAKKTAAKKETTKTVKTEVVVKKAPKAEKKVELKDLKAAVEQAAAPAEKRWKKPL